jgi:hypothetical protein
VMVTGDITDVCEAAIPPHDVLTGVGAVQVQSSSPIA